MGHQRPRGSHGYRPGLEVLEVRRVLAQFGVPWHDAIHLTVSFVPDGTPIAGQPSALFRTLDAQQPTAAWQREILSAFQTWAANADINFALTADGGEPLGTPGPDQGDPRFGDIRIGAVPMSPDVLSVSVPHDPFLSGTWSGDILLNSAVAFDGRNVDLFPVLLHEVGHVLGFDESTDPTSIMFSHLNNQQVSLAPSDVAAVQSLYGPRDDDPFADPVANDGVQTAAPLPTPAGFDGSTPLLIYANISKPGEADYFTVSPPAGYRGPMTIRMQTAGVSLLAPHLTVYDAAGKVVGNVSSAGDVGDTLQVVVPQVDPGATYTIKASGATGDLFGSGEYALAASFDARSTVGPDALDALARQSYSYLSPEDINAIFLDPRGALFHDDRHTNDTLDTAETVQPAAAYGSDAPIRITASLGDPTDVDDYWFVAPDSPPPGQSGTSGGPLVMTVTVRATEVNGIMPTASVLDDNGDPVPSVVLAHGDGTFTIQVADARPGTGYYVRVSSDPTTGKVVGNYDLDVEFGHQVATPTDFISSTLDDPASTEAFRLAVNQSQLFDLLLTAEAPTATPGVDVRMTITDVTGQVVATRAAAVGETAGGDPVFLLPGLYQVTFAEEASGPLRPPLIAFRLSGASLSDPIGPALDDPTLQPITGATSLPPVIGSTGDPYTWMALTLAVPRDQAGPAGREVAARQEGLGQQDGSSSSGVLVVGLPTQPDSPRIFGERNSRQGLAGRDADVQGRAVGRPTQPLAALAVAVTSLTAIAPPPGMRPPVDPIGPWAGLWRGRLDGSVTDAVASPLPTEAAVSPDRARSPGRPQGVAGSGQESFGGRSREFPSSGDVSPVSDAASASRFDPILLIGLWVAAVVSADKRCCRGVAGVLPIVRRAVTSRPSRPTAAASHPC